MTRPLPRPQLAPSNLVQNICGFSPGTVPPMGHFPTPVGTILDETLIKFEYGGSSKGETQCYILGGGGKEEYRCLVNVKSLVNKDGFFVADVIASEEETETNGNGSLVIDMTVVSLNDSGMIKQREDRSTEEEEAARGEVSTTTMVDSCTNNAAKLNGQPKPFFPVAPLPPVTTAVNGDTTTGGATINDAHNAQLQPDPTLLTVVGRITAVRRMAKRLVFADLAPPNHPSTASTTDDTNTEKMKEEDHSSIQIEKELPSC